MKDNKIRMIALTLLGLGLAACGGGGGDSGNSAGNGNGNPPISPPTESRRVVEGKIQAVDNATLTVNDQIFKRSGIEPRYAGSAWLEPLQVGMTVVITATGSHAEQIEVNPLLTGKLQPVKQARNTQSSTWSVNGIPISTKGTTSPSGEWVMVFGRYEQDGTVTASNLVPLSQVPTWLEIENRVSQLNESNASFTLGSLRVDYQGALLEDGPLAEGRWVEVYGRLEGDRLIAEQIEKEDDKEWPNKSELQGYIHYLVMPPIS